jgi:hypothetical protein
MKIEFNDKGYIEVTKVNNKISISIAATNNKQLIVNSVIVSLEDFVKIIKELNIGY